MQRKSWLQILQVVTIVVTAVIAVLEARSVAQSELHTVLLLGVLALLTSVMRVKFRAGSAGFEAAVGFPALLVFHDPAMALLPVLGGSLVYQLFKSVRGQRTVPVALYRASRAGLTFYLIGMLYVVTVAPESSLASKASAYLLLFVAYLVTTLFFEAAEKYFLEQDYTAAAVAVSAAQARILLLLTPLIILEALMYGSYGLPGLTLAFLPTIFVSGAVRNQYRAERGDDALGRRGRALSILTDSSSRLLTTEGAEPTLKSLVRLMSDLAKMKACAVVTWETLPVNPMMVYRFGECLPTDQAILKWVDSAGFAQTAPKEPIVYLDVDRSFPLSEGSARQVVLGIQTIEVIYGVVIFETEESVEEDSETLSLFQLVVNQTAISLQDQLLRELMHDKTAQLEKQAETMSTILDVSNGLIGQHEVDAMLTRIAEAVRKSLGFDLVVFALHDPRKDVFVRRAHAGLGAIWEEVRQKHVPASEITEMFSDEIRLSNSYFVSHLRIRKGDFDIVRQHDDVPRQEEWHVLDMLIVPLMSGEQLLGYLSVREPVDRKIPTLEKVQTLEIFASQAVTALQSAQQYEEIRRLTLIDGLTSAYNHRYFQAALRKEITRHERSGHSFALAMLDIDNFKTINDTWGHPVGDDILKGLVDELITNVRDIDMVSRYGGEEFAIIFPELPVQRVRDVTNRLRILISAREFQPFQIERPLRVTVSIGVAIFPFDGPTGPDLIGRADAALYQAKKNGKNQVVVASENMESISAFGRG